MSFSIALAGKGGTGKTTLAGLLIKYLVKTERTPILAVDADSNANFNEVLGLDFSETLGNAREEMKKGIVPGGMTKDIFMSMKLEQAIVESKGYDLVVMGQPEGPGCYCAANTLLTGFLEKLTNNYPYIVMDNEAGMEHISRLTTSNTDILLVVSDTSRRGIQAAVRINKLAKNLNIGFGKSYLIINQTKNGLPEAVANILNAEDLELAGTIPMDDTIYEYDLNGQPTIEMSENSKSVKAAFEIFKKIIK
ncbi:MAG: AAA family ATPase [Deltaproteobacteria bacterium]|nr:AAA family ATPase [Deltaproteobacteria bacterium]MBT8356395.1 AAA family ATPase [Deltaproteobacteria bacterium]MBT8374676.1 AAA family ATPase [Deltaproteobacteria bacterium]NNK85308.1 AAA family ATPase [Desulfobacterales bacterium]NNL41856.1 AAA family ATPase [Desulfobacterales bacterium]